MEAMIGQVLLNGGSYVMANEADNFDFVPPTEDTSGEADADLVSVGDGSGYEDLTQRTDDAADVSDDNHTFYQGYIATSED